MFFSVAKILLNHQKCIHPYIKTHISSLLSTVLSMEKWDMPTMWDSSLPESVKNGTTAILLSVLLLFYFANINPKLLLFLNPLE